MQQQLVTHPVLVTINELTRNNIANISKIHHLCRIRTILLPTVALKKIEFISLCNINAILCPARRFENSSETLIPPRTPFQHRPPFLASAKKQSASAVM